MTQLVGREHDAVALTAALEGRGLTSVIGSAGLGKTSLVRAALAGFPSREGGALRSLVNRPYLPLERALQLDLDGSVEDVAENVIMHLRRAVLFVDDLHWAHDRCIAVLDLVRTEATVVVASRREGLCREGACLIESGPVIELKPLSAPNAATLARTLHPALEPRDLAELVRLAGGSPLLLEMLVDGRHPSPTLVEALSTRAAHLDARTLDALCLLALAGRPIEAERIGLDGHGSSDLVRQRDGLVEFRHALLADAALMLKTDDERRKLHAQLASMLTDTEAVRHFLAAGEPARALEVAQLAGDETADDAARAELAYLGALAEDALGTSNPRSWLTVASALLDVGRYDDALDAADRAARTASTRAEALYLQGRARWFLGDPEAATAAFDAALDLLEAGTPLAVRILVERAYTEVRARRPGALAAARRALDAAEHAPTERLRAHAVLGSTPLYAGQPGWEEMLTAAVEEATRLGDTELACTAAYHLQSGLAFVGRMGEAMAVATDQARIAETAGLHTWRSQFLCGLLVDHMITGDAPGWVADTARTLLHNHPLFRNRFQAEAALVLALADMGQLADARATAELHLRRATTDESLVFNLLAMIEIEWREGNDREVLELAARARPLRNAWFGGRALCEIPAYYSAVELGLEFEAQLPGLVLPVFWAGLHEIDGLRYWCEGNATRALEELDRAVEGWAAIPSRRWGLRAQAAAAIFARRARRPGAGERIKAVIENARQNNLTNQLRRWGLTSRGGLSTREEQVLRLVAAGRTSAEIADTIGVSSGTVDDHVESARRKLGATTRREAAQLVHE